MEIGILRKSGTGALGLVKSKAVGGAFRGQYQNSIVGSIRLICCDLGVPLKCLQGLDHPSLLICFNENVGGKTMGKSGDCRQLQALPKSYSNLNLKKKKSCVGQATYIWPLLGPWVQFDICCGAGSLWDSLCLGGQFPISEVLVTCPQACLAQAPGPCAPSSCPGPTLAGFPRGTVSSIDFNKSFGWKEGLKSG